MSTKLWEAIDALREKGWVKRSIGSEDQGFCIVGALRYVHQWPAHWTGEFGKDCDAVVSVIRENYPEDPTLTQFESPAPFNDRPERTFEEVERVMQKAAILRDEVLD